MSTRRARALALQPRIDDLETRQLLSVTFRGVDIDGDTYVLRLTGPGDMRVERVDVNGNPVTDPTTPALIDTITVAGGDPSQTRLIGRVTKAAGGDGKVYFQNFGEIGGRGETTPGNLGLQAIDMPGFWEGFTNPVAPTSGSTTGTAATFNVPDGVITLRFGGVDTTFNINRPGLAGPTTNNLNDTVNVNLGLPRTQGTSIIIDQSITSGQAAATGSTSSSATQDTATYTVVGRLNLFQANSIEGNAAQPSTQFQGGTNVRSIPDSTQTVTGQIGFVRVGGNATNFAVQTNDKVSNYYIGGETNNIFLLAPNGSRNLYFGKGMDTADIRTHYVSTVRANRGAINSTLTVDRQIGQLIFGGDVINTTVQAGVGQNLLTTFSSQSEPTTPPTVQDGGAIPQILVAGDVTNSVFAASVDPSGGVYGTAEDLTLPHGYIRAKVEGTINNDQVSDDPTRAFFAHDVQVTGGPVVPPAVPEAPFPNAGAPPTGPRVVKGLQPSAPYVPKATKTTTTKTGTTATAASATPKGPAARAKAAVARLAAVQGSTGSAGGAASSTPNGQG